VTSELVARAQQGDHEAFEALATGVYDHLCTVARRILRDPYLAEDAVQDALIRAWRDLRSLRDVTRFDAWLYKLLLHACQDQARRTRRRPVTVAMIETDAASSDGGVTGLMDRDELERAFTRLSIEQRAVLVLTHYVGLPAAEVGAVLGISTGTVYSRLHYGARAMRQALTAPAITTQPERGR
jgi:RNA polymerase sigma-70 factor (ECF subfamily)